VAHWNRVAGKGGSTRVRVYTYADGKQHTLPRDLTRHLDPEPDHNVEAWVSQYSEQHERRRGELRGPGEQLANDRDYRKLLRLVEEYCEYLRADRKKAQSTVNSHRLALTEYVLRYYLQHCTPPLPDPNHWPSHSAQLYDYLQSRECSIHSILRVNIALRGMWTWLGDQRYLTSPYQLRLRTPPGHRSRGRTPLRITLTPEEVLRWIRTLPVGPRETELRLLALAGYFTSLRPQETLALRRSDFRAGSATSSLECCRVMAAAGLYSRLAVHVTRQRGKDGTPRPPKGYSTGWVACPDREAAILITSLLNQYRSPTELLLPHGLDWYIRVWREHGIPGVTLKDLRRASLLYLGNHTPLQLIHLQAHARHADPATTSLYLRRPEEHLPEDTENLLDLDA
jgi:integrase